MARGRRALGTTPGRVPHLSRVGQREDTPPPRLVDRHDGESADADQIKTLEGCVALDLGEGHRARESSHRLDVDQERTPTIARIGPGVCRHPGDSYARPFLSRVVVDRGVSLPHGSEVAKREWVVNPVPTGSAVRDEVGERVVRRLLLDQPVGHESCQTPGPIRVTLARGPYILGLASRFVRVVLVGSGQRPIPPTGYGGVERTIAEFAAALRRAGDEAIVINEVHPSRTGEYRFAAHLGHYRSTLESAIVHAHTPVIANRLARARIPFVYTTHSRHWFVRDRWSERWGFRLECRAVRRAAATVTPTDALRATVLDALRKLPPPGPVVTIPLGVDTARFSPGPSPGDPHVVLGVGAVIPVKRWHLAAQALVGTPLTLRLVGPTPDAEYAAGVRSSGPVELVGEVPDTDLPQLYREASFVVHPSRAELFPGVVVQAMATGKPVVGAPAIRPVIDDGWTGLIIEEGSTPAMVDSLRAAMLRLSEDDGLRASLGAAARRAAEERFDWAPIVEAHRALYRSVGAFPATAL